MNKSRFLSFLLLLIFFLLDLPSYAALTDQQTIAPQPTACMIGTFTQNGNSNWVTVSLTIKNNCKQTVDLQNMVTTFINSSNLNTSFWGNFGPIAYPDNSLQITSQPIGDTFLASFSLHIPEETWANSKLQDGQFITIIYGTPHADYDPLSVKVYLSTPIQTGAIDLNNASAKPANVTQNYALVNIVSQGRIIKAVQLPWKGQQYISGLAAGSYTIQPNNVIDSTGIIYQGVANPALILLAANQKILSTITYSPVRPSGKIKIQNAPLPSAISGYANNPTITATEIATGSSTNKVVPWNTTTLVDGLTNNKTFRFSTPDIVYNSYRCVGNFNPTTAISNATTPPIVRLTYQCNPISQVNVGLNVGGLTNSISAVNVLFSPNTGTTVTKHVPLTNGQGNTSVLLTQGTLYNVSATAISGYSATFNPQPLVANTGLTETVQYNATPIGTGKMISYIPGWKQPPSASELKNAGYTHVLIAFGVFSTTLPGTIVPAFDTITKSYIDSLHAANIKVLLSLGGASSSLPNTSVDFHHVLQMASSPTQFQTTFIQSLTNLINQFGFDGFDIDIEHGLNGEGPFQNPTGDIPVLANIINVMHTAHPNLLISLTPQTANIGATASFNDIWGNYSSLVMQTYSSLSWVGIQLYNSGCILGIDQVCYDPNATNTPDFSVAMAVDLLANWPATDALGRPTNFQPYISYLRADQIVLGYPAPNSQGASDGSPVTPTTTIKRAIECLENATANSTSCGNYLPPKAYGLIGGVFNWEITYDQNNQYKFARDLKTCVSTGICH